VRFFAPCPNTHHPPFPRSFSPSPMIFFQTGVSSCSFFPNASFPTYRAGPAFFVPGLFLSQLTPVPCVDGIPELPLLPRLLETKTSVDFFFFLFVGSGDPFRLKIWPLGYRLGPTVLPPLFCSFFFHPPWADAQCFH